MGLDIDELAAVNQFGEHGTDGIWPARVGRDQLEEVDGPATGVGPVSPRWRLPGVEREVGEVATGEIDGFPVVGHQVVDDSAGVDGHRRSTECFLGHVLPRCRPDQRRSGRKDRRRFGHGYEVAQWGGEGTVTGRGTEYQAYQGHDAGELGQTHQVARSATAVGVGHPVAGALQHHHQRDPLLMGELAEAIALIGGTTSDRATEHGHILGSGDCRSPVDPTGPGYQGITGSRWLIGGADQGADLEKGAGVEQTVETLPCVEPASLELSGETGLSPHPARLGFTTCDLVQ